MLAIHESRSSQPEGRPTFCNFDHGNSNFEEEEEEKEEKKKELECGPMPNLMVALPNISGALCSTPQSLADAHY